MLVYRVFPALPRARPSAPGHPMYVHASQGAGRWDNPEVYLLRYVAESPAAAIGEAFAHLRRWDPAMLRHPALSGSRRRLAVYEVDETRHPTCDLDDPSELVARALRPTQVVVRNRPLTQRVARSIYAEQRWSGIRWWSYHRPQWPLLAYWADVLVLRRVEEIGGHPALADAARTLTKSCARELLP